MSGIAVRARSLSGPLLTGQTLSVTGVDAEAFEVSFLPGYLGDLRITVDVDEVELSDETVPLGDLIAGVIDATPMRFSTDVPGETCEITYPNIAWDDTRIGGTIAESHVVYFGATPVGTEMSFEVPFSPEDVTVVHEVRSPTGKLHRAKSYVLEVDFTPTPPDLTDFAGYAKVGTVVQLNILANEAEAEDLVLLAAPTRDDEVVVDTWSSDGAYTFVAPETEGTVVVTGNIGSQTGGEDTKTHTITVSDGYVIVTGVETSALLLDRSANTVVRGDVTPTHVHNHPDDDDPSVISGFLDASILSHADISWKLREETDGENATTSAELDAVEIAAAEDIDGAVNGAYVWRTIHGVAAAEGELLEITMRAAYGTGGTPAWAAISDVLVDVAVPQVTAIPTISGSGAVSSEHTATQATWNITPDTLETEWLLDDVDQGDADQAFTPGSAGLLVYRERAQMTGGAWSEWTASAPKTIIGGYTATQMPFTGTQALFENDPFAGVANTPHFVFLWRGNFTRIADRTAVGLSESGFYCLRWESSGDVIRALLPNPAGGNIGPFPLHTGSTPADGGLFAAIIVVRPDGGSAIDIDCSIIVDGGSPAWDDEHHDVAQTGLGVASYMERLAIGRQPDEALTFWEDNMQAITLMARDSGEMPSLAALKAAFVSAAPGLALQDPAAMRTLLGATPQIEVYTRETGSSPYAPINTGTRGAWTSTYGTFAAP